MQKEPARRQQNTGTQQSIAMSSQRTAQYHWDTLPHTFSQLPVATQPSSNQYPSTPQAGASTQPQQAAATWSQNSAEQHASASPCIGSMHQHASQGGSFQATGRPWAARNEAGDGDAGAAPQQRAGSFSMGASATASGNAEVRTKFRICSGFCWVACLARLPLAHITVLWVQACGGHSTQFDLHVLQLMFA